MTDPVIPAQEVDVLIIGAGINGAGLFRDLCEQGLVCAIVDKADFGSGTSSAPSRLIHGGIKYLETGELRLVAQSTMERNLLLKNAPHAVKPLPTVIPIFSWGQGFFAALRTLFGATTAPRSRGAILIKIGLAMYDFYGARHRVMPKHALWSRGRALAEIPPLTPDIVAAGTYYDARVTYPERLVLELIKDGLAASPSSTSYNYAEFRSQEAGCLSFAYSSGEIRRFRPRIVINAAGPWIDRVNEQLGFSSRLIGGTKGSHILLDHPELLKVLNGRMIYFEARDGRICLVYDYLGRALVGSTDIRANEPEDVRCDDEEIEYFLQSLRHLLPALNFERSQIVYAYSGIRPLPASDDTAAGLISRDHSAPIQEPADDRPFPIISLVGGKWTTFRGFAEEVADTILAMLGRRRIRSTEGMPIGGGANYPIDEASRRDWIAKAAGAGADPERAEQLLDRYGSIASDILKHEGTKPQRLPTASTYSEGEIDWLIRHEKVMRLEDVVIRRTGLAIAGLLGRDDIEVIAALAAAALGWHDDRARDEIAATLTILREKHRFKLGA